MSLTTESAFSVNLRIESKLLYGWTTTSPAFWVSGNTEYVWISFFGKRSFRPSQAESCLVRIQFRPAIEWSSMKPWSFVSSLPSYIISSVVGWHTSNESLPIGLAIDYIHNFLMYLLGPWSRPHSPVVPGASAFLVHIEILWIVDILVCPRLYTVNHARF